MEIKKHRLLSFMELYKEMFGIALSPSEAQEKALLLVQYASMLINPLAKEPKDGITDTSNASE